MADKRNESAERDGEPDGSAEPRHEPVETEQVAGGEAASPASSVATTAAPGAVPPPYFEIQPPPPLFGDVWPEPDRAKAPVAVLAALVGGVAAAIFLPFGPPGIGWPLLGLSMAAGLFLVARKAERNVHIGRIGWAVTALLLLTVCAFRASEWLAALCVLTAGVAGALAVAGGGGVRAMLMAMVALPVSVFRALPWGIQGTRELRRTTGALRIGASVAVSLVLLLVFGALLGSADENFSALLAMFVPTLDGETFVRWTFLFAVFALGTLGASFTLLRPPRLAEPGATARSLRRWEWAMPVGTLVLLFAAFVVVQSPPMFGGVHHVVSTERLTYAVYARSGFWQLTMVTILTLPVIGAAARWAPKNSVFDRSLLRGLAGSLAVLTLVIVASALVRMSTYQHAYGYTVLRLLVQSCEMWLGLVYVLVIVAGIRLRARWLPTAVVGTAMAALLVLAVVDPEGLIAERNIARYQQTGKIDGEYLSRLSADVVPAVRTLPAAERDYILDAIRRDIADDAEVTRSWRSWNLSRGQVR